MIKLYKFCFPIFQPILMTNFIQASVARKRLNKFLNSDEIEFGAVTHNESESM